MCAGGESHVKLLAQYTAGPTTKRVNQRNLRVTVWVLSSCFLSGPASRCQPLGMHLAVGGFGMEGRVGLKRRLSGMVPFLIEFVV